jgi:hypothetical protein
MKPISHISIQLILITMLLAFAAGPLMAQVYKTVDENGNVTYTDQPPADGSKPIKLRPISVIEAPTYEKAPEADEESATGEESKEMTLKDLRKTYKDFSIIAPQPEETIWNPEEFISVAWRVGYQLQPGMTVTVFVDGTQYAKTTDPVVQVDMRDRGEHKVTAELKDARNRRIATAEPVVFYIMQPGLGNTRLRAIPRVGN